VIILNDLVGDEINRPRRTCSCFAVHVITRPISSRIDSGPPLLNNDLSLLAHVLSQN